MLAKPIKWKFEQICKCCSGVANLYGVVDFSKNSSDPQGVFLPLSGIPVYYYKCVECGFIFTTDFDDFSDDEFKEWIYNEDYTIVDPGWEQGRPRSTAETVIQKFKQFRETLSILDYGCGNGNVAKILREYGFKNVTNFDPMVDEFSSVPTGKFDLILCIEVFEHLVNPKSAFHEIAGFRSDDGIVFHSTLLQPKEIETVKLDWWYIGPRNGHISIFNTKSLFLSWLEVGLNVVSAYQDIHIAFKTIPDFAADLLKQSIPPPREDIGNK